VSSRIVYVNQLKLSPLTSLDEARQSAAVNTAIDAFGSLNVVINNAGHGNLSSLKTTPFVRISAHRSQLIFWDYHRDKRSASYFAKEAGHFFQFPRWTRIGPPVRGPISAAKWGSKVFSEVFGRAKCPSGHKVTIVRASRFPIGFAGSSTRLSEGHSNTTQQL